MENTAQQNNNAPTLVAIAMAARRANDRDLERYAKRELRDQHGVTLSFTKTPCRLSADVARKGDSR